MENYNGEGSAIVGTTGIPLHATNFFVNGRQNLAVYSKLTPIFSAAIMARFAFYANIHTNASQNDGLMDFFNHHHIYFEELIWTPFTGAG